MINHRAAEYGGTEPFPDGGSGSPRTAASRAGGGGDGRARGGAVLLRGLAHAHRRWLLRDDPTPTERYAPDPAADRLMRVVSAAFPAWCALSLGLPFAVGWWRHPRLGATRLGDGRELAPQSPAA